MKHFRSLILTWTIITTTFFWTTTMRLFMKSEISDWSVIGFSGAGLKGDYWFPVSIVLFSLFVFFLEGRGRLRRLFHALLTLWHLGLTFGVLIGSLEPNSDITFGAWGIHFSLRWLNIPMILFTFLTIIYVILEITGKIKVTQSSWKQVDWKTLGLVLLMFPISYVFFHYGEGFNLLVKLAIVINIVQWILLSEALGRQQIS